MKIIYLGTPDFAVKPLEAILERGYDVVAVISQPDKPVGRKREIKPTPVKEFALSKGLKVLQFDKIREHVEEIKALDADIMVTCAYGQILSQQIIDITKYGIYNIHASLLPLYRGASPISAAILNGDKTTGVTIMKTEIGIDSGDIVNVSETPIGEDETCGQLFDRLSLIGAKLICETLGLIESGKATLKKQEHERATFCKMIKKEDAKIDWNEDAEVVLRMIRAYNPSPIAYTFFKGKMLKIFSAEYSSLTGRAGQVVSADKKDGLVIACKSGAIFIKEVQMEGAKRMSYSDFVQGRKLVVGDVADL